MRRRALCIVYISAVCLLYVNAAPFSEGLSSNHKLEVESVAEHQQDQLVKLVGDQEIETQNMVDKQQSEIKDLLDKQQHETLNLLNSDVEDNLGQVFGQIQRENEEVEQLEQQNQQQQTTGQLQQSQQSQVGQIKGGQIQQSQQQQQQQQQQQNQQQQNQQQQTSGQLNQGQQQQQQQPNNGVYNYEDPDIEFVPSVSGFDPEPFEDDADAEAIVGGIDVGLNPNLKYVEDENYIPVGNDYENEIPDSKPVPDASVRDESTGLTGGFFKGLGDKWDKWTDKAVAAGGDIADSVGATLHGFYSSFKSGLPGIWEDIQETLAHMGVLVQTGTKCLVERIVLTFDEAQGSELVKKLEGYLEEGNEAIERFLQKVGEKKTEWEETYGEGLIDLDLDNHSTDSHYFDLFKDEVILGELAKLVESGILQQEEMDALTGNEIKKDRENVYMAIHFPKEAYSSKMTLPVWPSKKDDE